MHISEIPRQPKTQEGRNRLLHITAPKMREHVVTCAECLDLLGLVRPNHIAYFIAAFHRRRDSKQVCCEAYRDYILDACQGLPDERILDVFIATLVWMRDGYVPANDPARPNFKLLKNYSE